MSREEPRDFFILGKKVSLAKEDWANDICDIIDDAKDREAINDQTMIAYAILAQFTYEVSKRLTREAKDAKVQG